MGSIVPLPRNLVTQLGQDRPRVAVGRGGCLLPQSFGHVTMCDACKAGSSVSLYPGTVNSCKAGTVGAQLMLLE